MIQKIGKGKPSVRNRKVKERKLLHNYSFDGIYNLLVR